MRKLSISSNSFLIQDMFLLIQDELFDTLWALFLNYLYFYLILVSTLQMAKALLLIEIERPGLWQWKMLDVFFSEVKIILWNPKSSNIRLKCEQNGFWISEDIYTYIYVYTIDSLSKD